MKCYVINLDRSPDRLATFAARAAEQGIEFERVPAIDGRALPEAELAAWSAKCRITVPIMPNEVACFLSHREVWRRVANGDDPWAFIAEDDIVFSANAGAFFTSDAWLPADLDVVKAETMGDPIKIEMSGKVHARHHGHVVRLLKAKHNGAAGYFISRGGARRVLDYAENCCEAPDVILFRPPMAPSAGIKIGQMVPAICMQDFHFFPPDVFREGVNTIGHIPRLATRKAKVKKTLPVKAVEEFYRFGRHLRKFSLRLRNVSVYQVVPMISRATGP